MAKVSPLHSEEGRRLLDIIDKLKLLPSISHEIALPQIVVVGQQSSGKSSVLKAISNINFPTNSGFCTQFATEIICRRETLETTKAQIVPASAIDDQYRQRLEAFSQQWSQILPDQDVSEIIESAKQVMGLNDRQRISKDKLRLEFSGPTQDHISLIDLPGLFEQELPGQRKNDKKVVDEMVREYISGSQTIVLAVVSGAYDVQVQRIFRMFEPHCHRTLGIITAPDLVENGTARASTFRQLVANSSFRAGYGWHVLRNLSHREELGSQDRNQVEEQFFADQSLTPNNVWANIPSSQLGIRNLKFTLASLLQGSISAGLPHIQRQLRCAYIGCKQELELLGDERSTVEQQRDYLADKSEALRERTKMELNGASNHCSLRSKIRNANDRFADNMTQYGASWSFVQESTTTNIAVTPPGLNAPEPIANKDWVAQMLEEISNSRGRELDGLVNTSWVGRMFLRQSRKWRTLAECHVEDAFATVEEYFKEVVDKVVGSENGTRFLEHVIQPELHRRCEALKDKVAELLTPYSTEDISTLNRRFRSHEWDLTPVLSQKMDKKALAHNMVVHYTQIMDEYYCWALTVFVDNIGSLAIENVLLSGLEDIMTGSKAHKMTEQQLTALASESEEVTDKRRKLTMRIREYDEGSKIISRYSIRGRHSTLKEYQPTAIPLASASTETATPHIVIEAASEELVAAVSTIDLTSDDDDDVRQSRSSSMSGSSRASSVTSRISSEDDDSPQSRASSASSTPFKVRYMRRNKFEIAA